MSKCLINYTSCRNIFRDGSCALLECAENSSNKNKEKKTMQCNCGGRTPNHLLGIHGCFREVAKERPRKISCEDDKWFVEGHTITGTTLREQRGYYQHPCGGWSRPKDHESTNSLPDET